MSTNGKFEDPVDKNNNQSQPGGSPNFFPEQWNGVSDRSTGGTQPNTQQQLYDSAYTGPQDRRQQGDVPPEFANSPEIQQRANFTTGDGQGNTYNFYIREANINMGAGNAMDYRTNQNYDYRNYDQSYQALLRGDQYYQQQERMAQMREWQQERAMQQRQAMYDRWDRGNYDQPNYNYNQDTVYGGPGGYSASRTRVGYDQPNYGGTPPFIGDGSGRDGLDRVVDLGFGILDRVFANQAARRGSNNNNYDNYNHYPQQHYNYPPNYHNNNHYPDNHCYQRPRYQSQPYYGNNGGGDCYGRNNRGGGTSVSVVIRSGNRHR